MGGMGEGSPTLGFLQKWRPLQATCPDVDLKEGMATINR